MQNKPLTTYKTKIIEILAKIELNKIQDNYEKVDYAEFCIKSDGTRERCNIENPSVMTRFVCKGNAEEHLSASL